MGRTRAEGVPRFDDQRLTISHTSAILEFGEFFSEEKRSLEIDLFERSLALLGEFVDARVKLPSLVVESRSYE